MPDTGRTDTRKAIMDAAADVFAARGFHSATVREICAKANANIALVSRYFGALRRGVSHALQRTRRAPR